MVELLEEYELLLNLEKSLRTLLLEFERKSVGQADCLSFLAAARNRESGREDQSHAF